MQDVSTHWNSTLQMIQQLLRNKAVVFDNPHHKHNLFLLNESDWGYFFGALPLCNRTLGWRKVHFLYSCATNDVA